MLQKNVLDIFDVIDADDCTFLRFKSLSKRLIIYDPGFYHTANCWSKISKIDINDGKLYYRGVAVEEKSSINFLDIAYDLIFGADKSIDRKSDFKTYAKKYFNLYCETKLILDSLPLTMHPMEFLSIGCISLSSLEYKYLNDTEDFYEKSAFLIAQISVIATYYFTRLHNLPWQPAYSERSLAHHIMVNLQQNSDHAKVQKLASILNTIMIFHAEHGQNCSSATVRNVASTRGNLYTAVSSGIAAFNGPLHGGASQYVSEMYEEILQNNLDVDQYVNQKIAKKEPLMGFGQRTYNKILHCWDPRVKNMYNILNDPSFNFPEVQDYKRLANRLIDRVINDDYFIKRNITPNPDLFNCIFYKLFGVPNTMNPVMLSLGRIAGWIANYYEHMQDMMPITRPCDIHITR